MLAREEAELTQSNPQMITKYLELYFEHCSSATEEIDDLTPSEKEAIRKFYSANAKQKASLDELLKKLND